MREFETTRILFAPRLTVMNNQTAVLKVAQNEVYFTTSAQFPTTIRAPCWCGKTRQHRLRRPADSLVLPLIVGIIDKIWAGATDDTYHD